ncbi:serine/threonine-protein kinase [Actinomadura roseirufa]|uniref:serine/threonine-protein kinase n=1 Tax=Actinomadura roseirufa TaxID=2094049 RepID=UPI00104151A5|nr:serine/threonine-protein kinase [Actinomadura roseirufa]
MTPGLVLHHRYRLLERLATGGMGEVWRATDDTLGRQVAVKLLRLEWDSDATARGRFESEARFAAELDHPGIARAYDFGEQDGRAFLVMELVPGEPLDEILGRDGGLPIEAVLDLMVQAGRALTVAHRAGIVHRDVKPPNLMVSADGTLKITDFGIARRLAAPSQTATGMVMGTAHYISPEQASGQEISPSADLYSLGVVAYECLTGAPPFDGRTPVEIALKHVRDAPPELPTRVPAEARELIMRMLAKAPRDRPASADAVADLALEIRAALSTGRSPRPVSVATAPLHAVSAAAQPPLSGRPADQTSALPGFDGGGGTDNLTSGTEPGQRRPGRRRAPRRSTRTYTSVAAGILLVGVLVIGSLWKGLASVGGRDGPDTPRSPATSPAGGDTDETPSGRPGTPSARKHRSPGPTARKRHRTHRVRPSTPGTGRTSPAKKPMINRSRTTPNALGPAPQTATSTTTPSTPSPDPAPTQSGELGSEDKV